MYLFYFLLDISRITNRWWRSSLICGYASGLIFVFRLLFFDSLVWKGAGHPQVGDSSVRVQTNEYAFALVGGSISSLLPSLAQGGETVGWHILLAHLFGERWHGVQFLNDYSLARLDEGLL